MAQYSSNKLWRRFLGAQTGRWEGGNSVPDYSQEYDLADAMTMTENPEARREAVSRLVSEMATVENASGSCSICIESLKQSDKGDAKQVSCGHVYHQTCITNWLFNGRSNSCPLCRHEI
ncbi:E3 ubiquitin-protein ligase RNF181-like [Herrania umbratica]|uniref:RING-type E3 ubiquitin transferase n=1 Tax=Herrania umbratica TaxID=108875 RepID=A0A6J1AUS5_9ROSI|nr:E3 ubiquitin-protein ligase RNF181-like [Herrania umbratica]